VERTLFESPRWIATVERQKAKSKKKKARKARLDLIATVSELKDQKLPFAVCRLFFKRFTFQNEEKA